jgi:hypothetical protein
MPNEISYQFQFGLTNGELSDTYSSSSQRADQADAALVRNTQEVGSFPAEALDLAGVTTPGWAVFKNLTDPDSSPGNFVEIGIWDGVSGFHEFVKLEAGQQGMVRLGTSAPYARAYPSGVVELFYIIYEE